MKPPKQCPICGRSDTWIMINEYHSGFSFLRGLLGHLFIGRYSGYMSGLAGKRHKVYLCKNCKFQQTYTW